MIAMRTYLRFFSLLIVAASPALAAGVQPSHSPAWFEAAAGAKDQRWVVHGPAIEAEISADALRLAGRNGDILDVRLIGASGSSVVRGEEPLSARSFYFHGRNQKEWRGAQHFGRVRIGDVYPGVDAIYYDGANGLEADFVVSPGTDVSLIRLQFKGRKLALDREGNLRDGAGGAILMAAPAAWEGSSDERRVVPGGFRIIGEDRVAFRFDRRDRSQTLLIDPILSYATYFGGSGRDTIVGVERGADGRVYVAGNTTSVDLPLGISLNSPLIRPISLPVEDTFVACYNTDGSLAYVDYVGGDAQDLATSLAVDPSGRPTVAGYSASADFPTTPGAFSPATSSRDAFVYRVSADGSTLEYSTFLKVISPTWGYLATGPVTFLVSVDASGTATVGGTAVTFTAALSSSAVTVIGPTATSGVFQNASAGGDDIFLMRLLPGGTGVQWATYYGGKSDEVLTAMTLDAAGDVLVTGTTDSNNLPLVSAFQAAQPTNPNITAGFFAKFAPDAKTVAAASYLGGQSNNTSVSSIAVDETGAIYIAGSSPISATPGLTAVATPTSPYTPQSPAMILKLDPTGTVKQYLWSYGAFTAGGVSRIRVNASHGPCILTSFGQVPLFAGSLVGSAGYPGNGFACFGSDGMTLQFATLPPGNSSGPGPSPIDFALAPDGTIIGAANNAAGVAVTINAPEPMQLGNNGYVFEIQPQNPAPQLNAVIPSLIFTPLPGNTSTTSISLLGSNFAVGETVLWNGAPVNLPNPGNYFYGNSISGGLSTSTLNSLPKGDVQIQVSMPGPGGGTSNPLTVKYVNPAPSSITVTPQVVPVGSGATTFTVTGGLTSDCSITWNGAVQTLVSTGPSIFQFTIPAAAFTAAGDFIVVASNPAPGGGSATANVSVTATGLPAPTPVGAVTVGLGQGGTTQNLVVNFAPDDAVVVWNGSDRPTSRMNSTTLQFILSENDVLQMGSSQLQIRSGGVLGPAVTAYIGLPVANLHVIGDPVRGLAYFAGAGSAGTASAIVAANIPLGQIVHSVDLGSTIVSLFMTDDQAYLWVSTMDGRISRVNVNTFAIDMTATTPGPLSQYIFVPTAIPVPGTSATIVAAGSDGILRIFDSGVQRGFSSADLYPAAPGNLIPIFATPDAVWAEVGTPNPTCIVRFTWDYTGLSGFTQTCGNASDPWELPSPELKMDAGVRYFQSGLETLVWSSPRGYVDFAERRLIEAIFTLLNQTEGFNNYAYKLAIYGLDSEAQTEMVPAAGLLPAGTFIPYTESQALWSATNMLVIVDLPSTPMSQGRSVVRIQRSNPAEAAVGITSARDPDRP